VFVLLGEVTFCPHFKVTLLLGQSGDSEKSINQSETSNFSKERKRKRILNLNTKSPKKVYLVDKKQIKLWIKKEKFI